MKNKAKNRKKLKRQYVFNRLKFFDIWFSIRGIPDLWSYFKSKLLRQPKII